MLPAGQADSSNRRILWRSFSRAIELLRGFLLLVIQMHRAVGLSQPDGFLVPCTAHCAMKPK